ncbi:UNVERIFIED_CONTAM: hypothetical protein RMT77_016548 [Armadillidium vulgare]
MYNVASAWGPSRIVNKTRREFNQKLEKLDILRDLTKSNKSKEEMSNLPPQMSNSPKPVFLRTHRMNNVRTNYHHYEPPISSQHQELIKYFNDSWDRVRKEYDEGKQNAADNRGEGILFYERDTKHPDLENFKPFDLDLYWGKKMYKNSIQQR